MKAISLGNPYYGSLYEDEDRLAAARAARPAPRPSVAYLVAETHYYALVELRAARLALGRSNWNVKVATDYTSAQPINPVLRRERQRTAMRRLNRARAAVATAERGLDALARGSLMDRIVAERRLDALARVDAAIASAQREAA